MNYSQTNQGMLPSQVNDAARGLGQLGLGQVGLAQAQQNSLQNLYHWNREPMTASDLGIIDQNLDDKIGMEP